MKEVPTDSANPSPASDSPSGADGTDSQEVGMVLVFAAGHPYCMSLRLSSTPIEIGRGHGALLDHRDSLMSRRHVRVCYREGQFEVTDLGSRNGSAVNGVPLRGSRTVGDGALIRLGGSLFFCCHDIRPFRQRGIARTEDHVYGPSTQIVLDTVAHIAASSRTLHICGESGSGKESLAHAFHRAAPPPIGPLVAVNCAAIPEGIAERLLFGARKGAFSGAANDSQGYIEAADGGALFLDEIAELDMVVQGKLLRVIETGELLPLGAIRPRKVQFRVCTATHKDLRSLAEAGSFRRDLYFRIGVPQVSVAPLRARKEEIPWLILSAVQAVSQGLSADVSLVETCILRDWPGNVRELLSEIKAAALMTRAAGKTIVTSSCLRPSAGMAMPPVSTAPDREVPLGAAASSVEGIIGSAAKPRSKGAALTRQQVIEALVAARGNTSAAARSLGIHRTQLRRLLDRYKVDRDKLREL